MQALGRTQPLLRPGQAERWTHDYKRNGTTSLFMALDAAIRKAKYFRRYRSEEFRKFLNYIEDNVPRPSTPPGQLRDPQDGRRWSPGPHGGTFTTVRPRSQVERFFGLVTEKQLRRGAHRSTGDFERAAVNDSPKPFRWTKTKFWLSGCTCER